MVGWGRGAPAKPAGEAHLGPAVAGDGGLLSLVAGVAASWLAQQPPPPVPSSAPVTAFSAERAREHLRAMTGPRPTSVGSLGGDEVRDYLVDELSALGLATEVEAGLGAGTFGTTTVAGRVENVVATCPVAIPPGGSCCRRTTTPPPAPPARPTTRPPSRPSWRPHVP